MKKLARIGLIFCVTASAAQAWAQDCSQRAAMASQQQEHGHHVQDSNRSTGLPEAQRAQYLKGEGMGMARAAEMNHYPGPRHVLDNADRMKLSPEQLAATRALFSSVQEKAKALGRELVDREDELDRLFRTQTADQAHVKRLVQQIATLQGELRGVHLSAHVSERELLSPEQVRIYDELRNYVPGEKPPAALH